LQQTSESEAVRDSASAGVLAANNPKSATTVKSFRGLSFSLMGFLNPKDTILAHLDTTIREQNRGACVLTWKAVPAHIHGMSYSFLIFDFGGNEDAAQQARHRIEGWRQGFRLDKKLQLKFQRKDLEAKQDTPNDPPPKAPKGSSKAKPASKAKAKPAGEGERKSGSSPAAASEIRMIVRLDFSDHEKLSRQRWLERIPTEEPFKTAKPKVVRPGGPEFATTEDLYDSLD